MFLRLPVSVLKAHFWSTVKHIIYKPPTFNFCFFIELDVHIFCFECQTFLGMTINTNSAHFTMKILSLIYIFLCPVRGPVSKDGQVDPPFFFLQTFMFLKGLDLTNLTVVFP